MVPLVSHRAPIRNRRVRGRRARIVARGVRRSSSRLPRTLACAAMGRARSSALVVLVVLVAGGCGGDMRPEELARSVEALASAAAEGALLADGAAEDRTKTTFVRAHARELGEVVEHEAEKLADASATGAVATAKARAVDLAGRVDEALGQLQTAPGDAAGARTAGRALDRLADEATALAERL